MYFWDAYSLYNGVFFFNIVPLSEAGFSKIFLKTLISVHITCKDRENQFAAYLYVNT